MNARAVISIGACVLVAGGLGLGFAEIGSPAHNRLRESDARLQQAIYDIARATSPSAPPSLHDDERDQVTFERRSASEYALCGDFHLAGNEFAQYGDEAPSWSHPAGRYCYRFRWKRGRGRVEPLGTRQ